MLINEGYVLNVIYIFLISDILCALNTFMSVTSSHATYDCPIHITWILTDK